MTEQDDAQRDENGERVPVDEDNRSGMGSLRDIITACAQGHAEIAERERRAREERERHRAACTLEICQTCERSRCWRCEKPFQGTGLCAPCREVEAYERAKSRVFRSVPPRFKWAIERDLDLLGQRVDLVRPTLMSAVKWALDLPLRPPSLVLSGATGAGKTSLAIALFAIWFDKHRDEGARFAGAIDLGLAKQHHPLGHDEAPDVWAAKEAPLLILDDVGAEAARDADVVRSVLHARYNADLPTWITTGISRESVAGRYDAGVARRMFEEAKSVVIGVVS